MSNTARPYTKIEEAIRAEVARMGEQLDPITSPAWYFVVNFQDLAGGQPLGRLMRYDEGNRPFEPAMHLDILGQVIGNVRFADGRAHFDGNGHIEFRMAQQHVDQLYGSVEPPKIDVLLASPKDLVMIGHGQISAPTSGTPHANPVLYVQSAGAEFGLFVPDGSIHSRMNLDELGDPAGTPAAAKSLESAIWFAYIPTTSATEAHAHQRWVHEIVAPSRILTHEARQVFALSQRVHVNLEAGTTFTIGNAPGAQPFKGWLEEVIFDPTGSTGGGRGD